MYSGSPRLCVWVSVDTFDTLLRVAVYDLIRCYVYPYAMRLALSRQPGKVSLDTGLMDEPLFAACGRVLPILATPRLQPRCRNRASAFCPLPVGWRQTFSTQADRKGAPALGSDGSRTRALDNTVLARI